MPYGSLTRAWRRSLRETANVRTDKLLVLADHLEKNVPKENFHLVRWYREIPTCGTVACAGGHACLIPQFRRAGLRILENEPYYRGRTHFGAMMLFFGLTFNQAVFLFAPGSYSARHERSPKMVAKRIRRFVQHVKRKENVTV